MEVADKIGLLTVDDVCLDRILDFCDIESCLALSETCVRIRECGQRRIRKYRYLCSEISTLKTVKSAVKLIRHVGKHLTELYLEFEFRRDKYDVPPNTLTNFFEFLVDNTPNIRNLHLAGVLLCSSPQIYILCPIFRQLHQLSISHYCEGNPEHGVCFHTIDLPALCPNLRSLDVYGLIHFTPNPAKSFNGLLELSVERESYHSQILWRRLLQEHRNLKKLRVRDDFSHGSPCIDLDDVAKYLQNLEQFEVSATVIRNLNQLGELRRMQQLRKLNLVSVAARHTNMLSTHLPTLKQLSKLYIHTTGLLPSSFLQTLIDVAVELPNLKAFKTGAIKWDIETLTDFIRRSGNLEELTIYQNWGLTWTSELLRNLVDARRYETKHDQPLKLDLGMWQSYDDNFLKV